ncbi:antimicrobial peptide THP1-like [Varanus komodoensis]|uniref:antimicrobial peptide THP1-like n=1 Tax=Varanus komodoensis TaxID=61221 RepID=UPI001CF76E6B|nr:antimicrobial peptide THP1-like [Varanus komodoensis]
MKIPRVFFLVLLLVLLLDSGCSISDRKECREGGGFCLPFLPNMCQVFSIIIGKCSRWSYCCKWQSLRKKKWSYEAPPDQDSHRQLPANTSSILSHSQEPLLQNKGP